MPSGADDGSIVGPFGPVAWQSQWLCQHQAGRNLGSGPEPSQKLRPSRIERLQFLRCEMRVHGPSLAERRRVTPSPSVRHQRVCRDRFWRYRLDVVRIVNVCHPAAPLHSNTWFSASTNGHCSAG